MGMLYEYSSGERAIITGISHKIPKPTNYEVRSALAGLIGLIQLCGGNVEISESVRRSMLTNHRYIEAQRVLELLERS